MCGLSSFTNVYVRKCYAFFHLQYDHIPMLLEQTYTFSCWCTVYHFQIFLIELNKKSISYFRITSGFSHVCHMFKFRSDSLCLKWGRNSWCIRVCQYIFALMMLQPVFKDHFLLCLERSSLLGTVRRAPKLHREGNAFTFDRIALNKFAKIAVVVLS